MIDRLPLAVLVALAILAALPAAAQPADKERPAFDLKSLRARQWDIATRGPIAGVEPAVQGIVMTMPLPEGQEKGLGAVSRLFLLDAHDRIVFDSFVNDKVSDSIEPSVNSRTFFELKWSVTRAARGRPAYLVLSGTVPRQAPGEPIRTVQRTTVLAYTPGKGFEEVVDVVGPKPAITGPGEIRLLY
ncbi:MAG: hypothetical protein FJ087_07275 [Deltaproteobacteria bacterium]|nr:hypothetical protein [Deltaproteobacteria bacterium]